MSKKKLVRFDIGCGPNKKEGFVGVDSLKLKGVDIVADVRKPWKFAKTSSVDEVHSSHFVEHLTAMERVRFYNELWRVMKPDAKATIVVPHWGSGRAYGDPTHQWPPVSEMAFYYLDPKWREGNAPHADHRWAKGMYRCHFDCTWGYGLHSLVMQRSQEFQQWAINFYKEAAQDLHVTLTARK